MDFVKISKDIQYLVWATIQIVAHTDFTAFAFRVHFEQLFLRVLVG